MRYLVSEEELEKLSKGEIKVADLTIAENMPLLTWSGEDINILLKDKNMELDESIVNDIADRMDGCSCGDCVNFAFLDFIRDYEKK